jgi:DNA modification methylase
VGTGDRRWGANPSSTLAVPRQERRLTDVWPMATARFSGAHFAVMPEELVHYAILAGCRPGGVVLDPFAGSCTTGMVAGRLGRRFAGIELHRPYLELAMRTRLAQAALVTAGVADSAADQSVPPIGDAA